MASYKKRGGVFIGDDHQLTINRVLNAPRELVWKAWTEPELIRRWWGPRGFSSPVVEFDPRPGGKVLLSMRSPDGEDYWSAGVIGEIIAPWRLVMTDHFSDARGNPVTPAAYGMGDDFPSELLIRVTLEDVKGGTRLELHHSIPDTVKNFADARQGWNESIDKLEGVLAELLADAVPACDITGVNVAAPVPGC